MTKTAGIEFGRNSRGRLIGVALAALMGVCFVLPYAFGEAPPATGIESKTDAFVEAAVAQAKAEKQLLGMKGLMDDYRSGWRAALSKYDLAWPKSNALLRTAISEENKKPAEDRDKEFIDKATKMGNEASKKQQELSAERTVLLSSYNDARARYTALTNCYNSVEAAFKQCKNVGVDPTAFIQVYSELQRLAKESEKQAKEAVTGLKSIAELADKQLGEVEAFVKGRG